MKAFKYSFLILTFAIVLSVTLAHADINLNPNQYGISGQNTLHYSTWSDPTDGVIKKDISTQSFYNYYTFTTYTDPCTDCNIKVTLQKKSSSGSWSDVKSTTAKMKKTGYFSTNTAEAPGTYRIKMKRDDITAAWTYVTWDWNVESK